MADHGHGAPANAFDGGSPRRPLGREEFREVAGHFATGVTVVTAMWDGQRFGTTASAVCSVSLEPPTMLICMNRGSSTGAAVAAAGCFTVNVLGEHQSELARRFARKSSAKFDGVETAVSALGGLVLRDALAHIECSVIEEIDGGTHIVFLARVEAATRFPGAPLAYYRGRFGRLEPLESMR